MAKKNFDSFINAAGKKRKPTPEEVEEMAKQIHEPIVAVPTPQPPVENKPAIKPKPISRPASKQGIMPTKSRNAEPAEAPKEKVRITIDLAKDLYKRMKLAVVENETEISAYVRMLIETDLNKK